MNLHETDTVLMLWTAAFGTQTDEGDWMCTVWLHEGKLCGEYRFRYHREAGFSGQDVVNRYTMTPLPDSKGRREQLFHAVREMLRLGTGKGFYDVRETVIDGPPQKLMAALMDLPNWRVNMSTVPKETR